MSAARVIVVGGGAAGCFAGIACAESAPATEVTVLEKSPQFLSKVRISGGGRCNVTHACYDLPTLAARYPRGGRELIGPFARFQPRDTVAWFEERGVPLKAEPDGRIFPASNRSQSILDCIRISAEAAGVILAPNCAVGQALRSGAGSFALKLADDRIVTCERLLLATGGSRTAAAGRLAVAFGHSLSPPVPSLFGFRLETPWLGDLAGISIEDVAVTAPDAGLEERGALLLTQGGVSGPAILCLSAWGARVFHSLSYRFPIRVNWLPHLSGQEIEEKLHLHRGDHPSRLVVNGPIPPLPGRLWERLVQVAGIQRETRWSALSRSAHTNLLEQLSRSELQVSGRSLNKEEFVTCGGVRLNEVDFKTMESRLCPGLYFAGEVLDIDGPTGGFNFQAAWTTGWLAGRAMARESR